MVFAGSDIWLPYKFCSARSSVGRAEIRSGLTAKQNSPSPRGRRLGLFMVRIYGAGEIRTHETLSGPPVFKTGAFNHSATTPTAPNLAIGPRVGQRYMQRRMDRRMARRMARRTVVPLVRQGVAFANDASRAALNSAPALHVGHVRICATRHPTSSNARASSAAPLKSQSALMSSLGL